MWWLRRVVRPWETVRVLAPRVLPPRLRWRLTSILGRVRPAPTAAGIDAVDDWQEALANEPVRRPLILGLRHGRGGAESETSALAALGFQVIDLGEAVSRIAGCDLGTATPEQALRSIAELRRQERIREAVVSCDGPEGMQLAGKLQKRWGWPLVEALSAAEQGAEEALRTAFPLVSILVVTHNNSAVTRLCLDSVRRWTGYPNREVVVVDNASSDDTARVLAEARDRDPALRFVVNNDNLGFAAACNQAARMAEGGVLCFLNNDTVVTPGWLWVLVRQVLDDPRVGLVGPVSNAVANEARVGTRYESAQQMQSWADGFTWRHDGRSFRLPMLALFCAVTRREVWNEIGELDEGFGVGLFEDDDYCRRLRRANFHIVCRRDAFVHHWQQASFRLLDAEGYLELYERNRVYYRRKWS